MTYYVHAPDGQKYGPADLQILQQWIHAGSVISTTIIEDPQTGMKFQASQIPGLVFMAQSYPRLSTDIGEKDYKTSWWCFGLAFLPCLTPFFASYGIYSADLAKRKGHPNWKNPFIANVTVLAFVVFAFLLARLIGRML